MSIFKKDCPECARSNSVDAVRCSCGYCFDPDALAGADAAEYQEEQDRLYRDYLDARIVQAEIEMTVAREQASLEPGNTLKAAAALVAEQSLNALRAEMNQLALRLPATKPRRAPAAPKPTTPPPAKAIAPAARAAATAAPKATPKHSHKFAASARSAEREKPTAPATAPWENTKPRPALPAKAQQAKPTPSVETKKPIVPEKPKPISVIAVNTSPATAKPPIKTPSPAPQPIARRVEPIKSKPHHPMAKPQSTTIPSARFRRMQARKAEAIAKAVLAPPSSAAPAAKQPVRQAVVAPATPSQECPSCTATVPLHLTQCRCGYAFSRPSDVPALALDVPVAPVVVAQPEAQECPNCTATVPASRKQCGCGYTFSQSTEQVPALALDATALAILTDGIGTTRPLRRR